MFHGSLIAYQNTIGDKEGNSYALNVFLGYFNNSKFLQLNL